MFSSKMVNFTGIWIFFALALPTHVFDPFLYTLFHYRMTSVRRLQTGGASLDSWRPGQLTMTWGMKLGSVHVRTSLALIDP